MKKYLLFLVLIVISYASAYAQRMDDQRFKYTYERLPLTPLQADFKTYSVRIDPGSMSLTNMGLLKSQMPKSFFSLNAYELVANEGDFEILVQFDGDYLLGTELKKKTTTTGKDENKKTVTTYSYQVSYRIPITYSISDGKREVMVEEIFSFDHVYKKSFGKERYSKTLQTKWENNGQTSLNSWVKADFNELLKRLGAHFRSQFDTREVTQDITFYSIKKANKIGYETLAERTSEVGPVLAKSAVETKLAIEDFGDLIDLWKEAMQSADASDKKESVAYQTAAYNLAMANLVCGNYGDALTFSTKLNDANKRGYLEKSLTPLINRFTAREKANQKVEFIYHPTFDKASALLNSTPIRSTTELVPEENLGHVILLSSRDTLDGILHYDYKKKGGKESEIFSLQGVRVENAARSPSSRYIKIGEIANVTDNGVLMIPVEIAIGPIGVITIQRVVHTVKGLMLTHNFHNDDDSYCFLRLVPNKKGEAKRKVYFLEGLAFLNFNKGIRNKFEDCPTIFAKAEAKEYERTETSFLQILEDYDGCAPDFD